MYTVLLTPLMLPILITDVQTNVKDQQTWCIKGTVWLVCNPVLGSSVQRKPVLSASDWFQLDIFRNKVIPSQDVCTACEFICQCVLETSYSHHQCRLSVYPAESGYDWFRAVLTSLNLFCQHQRGSLKCHRTCWIFVWTNIIWISLSLSFLIPNLQ